MLVIFTVTKLVTSGSPDISLQPDFPALSGFLLDIQRAN